MHRPAWQHPTLYWLLTLLSVGGLLWVMGAEGMGLGPVVWAQTTIITADAISTPTPATTPATILQPTATPVGYHDQPGGEHYTVQAGDTLLTVALEVGLDLAKLPCAVAPTFRSDQPLVIGDQLEIPGPQVICHQVQAGETLATVAERYGMAPVAIAALPWNQLAGTTGATVPLAPGNYLRIDLGARDLAPSAGLQSTAAMSGTGDFLSWMLGQPRDTSPFVALAVGGPFAEQRHQAENRAVVPANQPGVVPQNWPYGSGHFTWPLAGWLTQPYRYDHRAIDIAAPAGTVVTAADRGVVVRAGWNNQGYGLFVIIDHNIDYITLYAHLSEILVTEGQIVAQGEVLGKVGSTGNSTGPHLHFEIRDFGRLTNPLELLAR